MKLKTCSKCEKPKDLNSFRKLSRSKDGLNSKCKSCLKEEVEKRYLEKTESIDFENTFKICLICNKKQNLNSFPIGKTSKDARNKYCKRCNVKLVKKKYRTKRGLLERIYTHQKSSSKNRNHPIPHYTKEEFIFKYINNKKYLELYNKWVESNYNMDKRPSFDRLDNNLTYSFENIRIVTFRENYLQAAEDKKNNKIISNQKKVDCFDLENNFIQSFLSVRDAARSINVSSSAIHSNLSNKSKSSGNFIWKYSQ